MSQQLEAHEITDKDGKAKALIVELDPTVSLTENDLQKIKSIVLAPPDENYTVMETFEFIIEDRGDPDVGDPGSLTPIRVTVETEAKDDFPEVIKDKLLEFFKEWGRAYIMKDWQKEKEEEKKYELYGGRKKH